MEDENFVADSDEDEQELLDALALVEERLVRQRLEPAAAAKPQQFSECLEEPKAREPKQDLVMLNELQTDREQKKAQDERNSAQNEDGKEGTDDEQDADKKEEKEEAHDEEQVDDVLAVGTVVEVESRTWPGINKQGGAGRVTRVYKETSKDGEVEAIFYDVRYVLGGFERHVEQEYVHSSKLLKKHSNRAKVGREYYHDDYINEPHLRKQREAEEKREKMMVQLDQAETHVWSRRKRKRSHYLARADQVLDTLSKVQSLSDSEMEEESKGHKLDDDISLTSNRNKSSRSVVSQPRHKHERVVRDARNPSVEEAVVTQRRRNRILDSSDEESSHGGGTDDNSSQSPDQLKYLECNDVEKLAAESSARNSRNRLDNQYKRSKRKGKVSHRRFVGGYEHNEDDADGNFIQPEGNPDKLPDDVIRVTGLRLETTKDGLMKQLKEVFVQQQKNIASFHEEQKKMDQKMKNILEMPLSDLQVLYFKVLDLEKNFLTKILVNAGEDTMDSISRKLDRCGKLPATFEQLDRDIDDWKNDLKECSQWVHTIRDVMEDVLSQRNALIHRELVVQAEYSSESSYSADNDDVGILSSDTADVDNATDNLNTSFGYEIERTSDTRDRNRQHDSFPEVGARRLLSSKAEKRIHGRKVTTSTSLDDYNFRQESRNNFTTNLRLPRKQKNVLFSDPRWAWVKIARRKQQRAGRSARNLPLQKLSIAFPDEHVSVRDVRSTNVSSRDESNSIQAQRMRLRNKRLRARPKQWQSRELVFVQSVPHSGRSSYLAAYPAGISFDEINPEKRVQPAKLANPCRNNSKQQAVDWEAIFEVVSDGPSTSFDEDGSSAISPKGQEALLAFGHRIRSPLDLPHRFFDEENEFEDCERFKAVVTRRISRLQQFINDLRLQESIFMDSLSKGGLDTADEEYENLAQWKMLVSLEEAYHKAIASLVAHLMQALKEMFTSDFASCLTVIWKQIAALIRQLPDCYSLVNGCKAYFFFFEVASRGAITTPLLTAVLRTYWYCIDLLENLQFMSDHLTGQHVAVINESEDDYPKTLPVNKFILAVVLFLFDLYIYLPLSHRVEDKGIDGRLIGSSPALSLWLLVRDCSKGSAGVDLSKQESLCTKEKHVWALLQAVYRQRYFDELARYFVRSESCGGYLRDFEPSAADAGKSDVCDEIFESQMLSLETTWNLVAVLSQIYADSDGDKHEEAVCDAKWAIVKDLLQPGNPDFLPFAPYHNQSIFLQSDFCRGAHMYKQHVLRRVTIFSKHWNPSKEIVAHILCQLWGNDKPSRRDAVVELPRLFKQFLTRCRELGNSKSRLVAFAGAEYADDDFTTALCKIIWIQLLKLEKRVHRSRFRRSILSAIPHNFDHKHVSKGAGSVSTEQISLKMPEKDWCWGSENDLSDKLRSPKRPAVLQQVPSSKWGIGKERTSTAVLLVFAVVNVCLECGNEQYFPAERSDKDVRFMEREVDFYCKEILRWTSEKSEYDVLAAQALFTLGALLLEKNSAEFPTVFWGLNERLDSSMKSIQGIHPVSSTPNQFLDLNAKILSNRRQRSRGAAISPLYHMRDLIIKMLQMPSSGMKVGPAFGLAVIKSLEHVFSTGMETCLNFATQRIVVVNDLKIALDIFQLLLARAPDEPTRCFALPSSPGTFDDDFDDALAMLDIDEMLVGHNSGHSSVWNVKECRSKVIQLITSNLRVAVQHLVLHYPSNDAITFEELYVIDLLGLMISTCSFQFFWSNLTSTSVKSRNLAPRVLSAALKYNADGKWLRNVFIKESEADQGLSIAWLMGTLDVAAFSSIPVLFILEDVPFSMDKTITRQAKTQNHICICDSDYWLMLTDGIIFYLLRNGSYEAGAKNPHVLSLLREVASICKFRSSVKANKARLRDTAILYDLHLDVFQSFCQSAGNTWSSYTTSHSSDWHEMNLFRAEMVNPSNGIFVSFLEAYKINYRRACREIDHWNHNWHKFAKLFLRQAGVNVVGGRSYHEMDDSIKTFDERLTGLTTMFRFMYHCMDAFLYHCGQMAIGETNLYFSLMELFFRQVNGAEYPQAIKRLEDQRRQIQRDGRRSINDELRKGVCSASMRFIDSVQLFFALQKYPSLLHWFAQTSEIYQTLKKGWLSSPLRTLLVNVLDPDGPLGIHSYYPDEEASKDSILDFDVKTVRREAFYLSCGVFNCRCTRAFEHSRAKPVSTSLGRLQQVRKFVLDEFIRETLSFVQQENASLLLETMVPLSQFVRAILNHANLNLDRISANQANNFHAEDDVTSFNFQLDEIFPCLEWIVECMMKLIPGEEAVHNAICCVLSIELCGIISETIIFNDKRPMLELINLVELVLSYLQNIYLALSKRTTAAIDTLFVCDIHYPLSVKLSAYRFSASAFRDIVVDERLNRISGRQWDSYGISLARASTDLLAAIHRVALLCKASSDERLRSLTTNLP